MNLCRLLLQCGIEACFYNENEDIRTMGASLSNEIAINAENIALSNQLSMQGAVRCVQAFISRNFEIVYNYLLVLIFEVEQCT